MKVNYLVSLLAVCGFFLFSTKAQCDLVLTDVDIEAGTFTIDFVNTTSCGGTGGPDGVSEIQIGFQALDPNNDCAAMNQGWTFPSGITIPDDSNHPGWVFSSTSNEANLFNWTNLWPDWPWDIVPPYYAGETITFPLYNQYQNDCVNGPFANSLSCQLEDALNFWLDEGYSIQAVIWQISYGPTMYAADGGWAEVGANGDGTSWGSGLYEDGNFLDNWLIIGPCEDPNPGPDAVIGNVQINTGCIEDMPVYNVDYTVYNYGDEEITDYCIEIWNEDYYQCFDSDLFNGGFGEYAIPVGEAQAFTTPFFEWETDSNFFVISVDNVNGTDEIVTGNNNTTVFYPDYPECPTQADTILVELPPDTLIEYVTLIDTLIVVDTIYIELPPDTIILTQIDTVYVPWEWYIYDTVYVDNFIYDTTYIELPPDTILITQIDTIIDTQTIIDTLIITNIDTLYIELPPDTITLIETEFVYDTTFIELPPDTITLTETEFIFVTDTIYETEIIYITDSLYITLTDTVVEYQFIEIDCSTGLPCSNLGFDECDPLTIYIPNTFTPNNDGVNDVWEIIIDPDCWTDVEAKVYNRWGNLVWESYDPYYLLWNGSNMNGSYYVPDGVYYWSFNGRKINTAVIEELQGHVTLFR